MAKRYSSLHSDLSSLKSTLEDNPTTGTSLGGGLYKVRLAIKSKGKGKSGGARVISYYLMLDNELILLTMYDKADQENISEQKINKLLSNALKERHI